MTDERRNRGGNMTNRCLIDEHKTAVKRMVETFNSGDVSEVHSLFAADYVDHQRPSWLDVNGPEEFEQLVQRARESLLRLHVRIADLIAEGNMAAARLHWHII